MAHRIAGLDHVQLAMPRGEEAAAEAFYGDLLGFDVLPKPPVLAARGGRWFGADGGRVQVHLGVEEEFRPAKKAHPALLVDGLDGSWLSCRRLVSPSGGTTTTRESTAATSTTPSATGSSSSPAEVP